MTAPTSANTAKGLFGCTATCHFLWLLQLKSNLVQVRLLSLKVRRTKVKIHVLEPYNSTYFCKQLANIFDITKELLSIIYYGKKYP